METIMEEGEKNKAQDLFKLCDQDGKGYVTNDDLKKLQDDLALNGEQIEIVFNQLDKNGDGYLTAEEFEKGLEMFMVQPDSPIYPISEEEVVKECQSIEKETNHSNVKIVNENAYEMIKDLKFSELLQDNAHVELWCQIQSQHPELLPLFQDFLQNLAEKHELVQNETAILKDSFSKKTSAYEQQIRILYEEMESQIKEEKEAILNQKCSLEKQLRQQLDEVVETKDRDLQDLLGKWLQASQQLKDTSETKIMTENENQKLQQEKEMLESQLDKYKQQLQELHTKLDEFKSSNVKEKQQQFWSAFHLSEKIAFEREALVKQLHLLRSINRRLQDENDEIDDHHTLRESSSILSKRGSIMSDYFEILRSQPTSASSHNEEPNNNDATTLSSHIQTTNPFLIDNVFASSANSAFASTNPFLSDIKDDVLSTYTSFSDPELDNFEDSGLQLESQIKVDKKQPALCLIHPNNHQANGLTTALPEPFEDPVKMNDYANDNCNSSNEEVEIGNGKEENDCGSLPLLDNGTNLPKNTDQQLPESLFKIVFIGDSGVGKTSLINRICGGQFSDRFCATIGVDFRVRNVITDGRHVVLQLWDTAGQERFRSITTQYLRKSDGVLITYDTTSEASFCNVSSWMSSIENVQNDNVVIALLGNKSDLSATNKVVPTETGRQLADASIILNHYYPFNLREKDALFFETSAKDGTGIEELILMMASKLQKQQTKELESCVSLKNSDTVTPKKMCC